MQVNQKWHKIKWRNAYDYIAKLQKELVVAFKKKNWEKVYFLQNKIMMSFEGRAISARKVASNKGRTTPGFDKVVWKSPSDKYKAIIELRNILFNKSGLYKSGPVRRVWVKKSFKKDFRPLGIPNMIDRALQALVLLCFDPIVEEKSDLYSFGFRKFRGTDDAVQRIRTILDNPLDRNGYGMLILANVLIKLPISFSENNLKLFFVKKEMNLFVNG